MKIIIIAFALIAFVGADVSHLSGNYLPPQDAPASALAPAPAGPSQEYVPPQQEEEIIAEPAPIASAPGPIDIAESGPGPAADEGVGAAADEGTEVGADGYRYKTVKRIRYRYRV